MKLNFISSLKMLSLFIFGTLVFTSCEYDEIKNADYAAAKLYMPAASNGVFAINNVPQRVEFLPTAGYNYRFKVDLVRNKLIIPLGVYRSGVDKSAKITATIAANPDTITVLKSKPTAAVPATTIVLPADKYTLPTSVEVASGSQTGDFSMEIDLDYLRSFPDAIIGIGVGIKSTDITVNPLLGTTIIAISTKILNPTAIFTATVDAANKAKVKFKNTSLFGVKYSWDFGDSTPADTAKAPIHYYAASGSYTVKLNVEGVLGSVNKVSYTIPAPIVISLKPIVNYIYSVDAANVKKINFTNQTINAKTYSWNFGDGTPVSTETSPSHVYAAAGTYTVVLTATPDNTTPSNVVSKSVTLTVK